MVQCSRMSELEIAEKVNGLSVGRSFKVISTTERQYALNEARRKNLRIATRAIRGRNKLSVIGFTVTRLPE